MLCPMITHSNTRLKSSNVMIFWTLNGGFCFYVQGDNAISIENYINERLTDKFQHILLICCFFVLETTKYTDSSLITHIKIVVCTPSCTMYILQATLKNFGQLHIASHVPVSSSSLQELSESSKNIITTTLIMRFRSSLSNYSLVHFPSGPGKSILCAFILRTPSSIRIK